jgi:hypothetical protein
VKPQLGPSKSSVSLVASKLGLPFKNKALEKGAPKISSIKTSSASGTPRTEERVLHKIMKTSTGTATLTIYLLTYYLPVYSISYNDVFFQNHMDEKSPIF